MPVVLSGDAQARALRIASDLGTTDICAGANPADKVATLQALSADGHTPLMVGDGLCDAGALAAAHVSMAPASASDMGRTAADFIFLRDKLNTVPEAIDTARGTARVVRHNFALAIAYNCIDIALAVAGLVTPPDRGAGDVGVVHPGDRDRAGAEPHPPAPPRATMPARPTEMPA